MEEGRAGAGAAIPWLRLLAEGFAILASILVAFAIDAWWDRQSEREREARAIAQLTGEFAVVLDELLALEADYAGSPEEPIGSGGVLDLSRALRSMGTPIDPARADSMIAGVIRVNELRLPTGVLAALIASGELALLESDELRASLADWEATASIVRQDVRYHQELVNDKVLPFLWERISMRSVDVSTGYHGALGRGPFPHDPVALFQDREFENLVNEVLTTIETGQARLDDAVAHAEEILFLLEGGELDEVTGDPGAPLAGASGEA